MKNYVITSVCALVLLLAGTVFAAQDPVNVFPKHSFRGDAWDGFIEVAEQPYLMTGAQMVPNGEIAIIMLNIDYIREFVRYEDVNKTDYSCLVSMEGREHPILLRLSFDKLKSLVKKAADR